MDNTFLRNKRLIAIDVLKALAVLLILNHRMQVSYVDCSMLATGGALGCGLFFFISGYCLAHASVNSFKEWMYKRMSRLLPPVLIVAFICNYGYLQAGSYWFLQCIVAYYIAFYFVKAHALKYLHHIIALSCTVYAVYFISYGYTFGNMYGATTGKYFLFFIFFLCGVAFRFKQYHPRRYIAVGACIFSPVILAGEMLFRGHLLPITFPEQLMLLSPVLLLIGIIGLFVSTEPLNALNNHSIFRRFGTPVFASIGALSLESYIGIGTIAGTLQKALLPLFPFNLPLVVIGLLLFCYFLRVCTRLAVTIINGRLQDLTFHHILKPY